MTNPNLIILYVDDPVKSSDFYAQLFHIQPDAVFSTYAAFTFDHGLQLGLWSTGARDFMSGGTGHRTEIAFQVNDDKAVDALYADWMSLGLTIEQPLMDAVFGRTFVALDPDGHRLRVCTPDN